jgi:lysophospholipid acyltransferase 5
MQIVIYIVLRCYTIILSGWCLVPFVFLSFSKWWQIYKAVHFFGWIVFGLGLFVIAPLARALLPPTAVKKDK